MNTYNSIWNTYNQTYNGNPPPSPYVIGTKEHVKVNNAPQNMKLYRISSNRTPFASEHLDNGYGTLNTVLGTTLGLKK